MKLSNTAKVALIRHASKNPGKITGNAQPEPTLRVTDDGSIRETNIHRIRKIIE